MTRLGMIIDLAYCIGCNACTIACKQEQGTPPDVMYARVLVREYGEYPNLKKIFLPLLCMHCEEAACMAACPSHAIVKTEEGVVIVDEERCCGSRACVSACPYGAIFFPEEFKTYFPGVLTPFERYHAEKRKKFPVAMKCNLCIHRVREGREPACVVTCPTECRIFGDWDDKQSKLYKYLEQRSPQDGLFPLRPEAGTKPKVLYLPDRPGPRVEVEEEAEPEPPIKVK